MTQTDYLLSDAEMAQFLVNGYHMAQLDLPEGLNETIEARLEALESNPGDAITEAVPELWQVLDNPEVTGIMTSLAGVGYQVSGHRHWHCKQAGTDYMHWHQDGTNSRERLMEQFLGLYYPTAVSADMGPTVVVPGTHFRNAPTDRMASYTNIRGQIPVVVKAGTIAFTHYDIWHGTAANRSNRKRHMIKFVFRRSQPNTGAHLESRSRQPGPGVGLERSGQERGREQHPDLRTIGGCGPERPLQGRPHPERGVGLSNGGSCCC